MQPILSVRFYRSSSGVEPVREWLKNELSTDARRMIGADVKTIQYGWPIGMPLVRKMEPGLWETRSRIPEGIARIMFTVVGADLILLHGFVKKSQQTPKDDLETARRRMKEVKS